MNKYTIGILIILILTLLMIPDASAREEVNEEVRIGQSLDYQYHFDFVGRIKVSIKSEDQVSIYIVDEENYNIYRTGADFKCIEGVENIYSTTISTYTYNADYYVVIINPGYSILFGSTTAELEIQTYSLSVLQSLCCCGGLSMVLILIIIAIVLVSHFVRKKNNDL